MHRWGQGRGAWPGEASETWGRRWGRLQGAGAHPLQLSGSPNPACLRKGTARRPAGLGTPLLLQVPTRHLTGRSQRAACVSFSQKHVQQRLQKLPEPLRLRQPRGRDCARGAPKGVDCGTAARREHVPQLGRGTGVVHGPQLRPLCLPGPARGSHLPAGAHVATFVRALPFRVRGGESPPSSSAVSLHTAQGRTPGGRCAVTAASQRPPRGRLPVDEPTAQHLPRVWSRRPPEVSQTDSPGQSPSPGPSAPTGTGVAQGRGQRSPRTGRCPSGTLGLRPLRYVCPLHTRGRRASAPLKLQSAARACTDPAARRRSCPAPPAWASGSRTP